MIHSSKILPIILLAPVILFLQIHLSNSYQPTPHNTRRNFLAKAATIAAFGTGGRVASAAIDVSGLPVEGSSFPKPKSNANVARGMDPSQLKSGPLANSPLGFQVGGGPRPEEVVREIDAPRYDAARKAQGLGPKFLEGVPIEANPERVKFDLEKQQPDQQQTKYAEQEIERFGRYLNDRR